MRQHESDQRAEIGSGLRAAFLRHVGAQGYEGDATGRLTDLLADLLLRARSFGLDAGEILYAARCHWEAESGELATSGRQPVCYS